MQYEMMFPEQIRTAINENLPVVLPVGVLEYHAEHCVVGVDSLLVVKALEILEKEIDMVLLPPFHYGSASYAVEPPENNGTIHVDSQIVQLFARELFLGLLRVGFRNIHAFIHHQSENFIDGMPTDLALRLAARQVTFEFLEKNKGQGWWGNSQITDHHAAEEAAEDPFSWIKVHPFMDEQSQKKYPLGHAGFQETSLMMAFCPEGVDMSRLSEEKWYCKESRKANDKHGESAKEMILEGLRKVLKPK